MTPLVMEQPPEPVEKVREPARVAEDWPGPRAAAAASSKNESNFAIRVRPPEAAEEDRADEEGPLLVSLAPLNGEREGGHLHASFAALAGLRGSREPGAWIETAATLKRDAVRLRNSPYARHADVLLTLADALTFTDPAGISDGSLAILGRGLAVLSEPFISEPDEEAFLVDLMAQGWHLAPAVDPDDYPA